MITWEPYDPICLSDEFNLTSLKFKGQHTIYENLIKVTIRNHEMNLTYNPTILERDDNNTGEEISNFTIIVDHNPVTNISSSKLEKNDSNTWDNYHVKEMTKMRVFKPYISSIGIYNDFGDLLIHARLGQTVPLSKHLDTNFLIKYDI